MQPPKTSSDSLSLKIAKKSPALLPLIFFGALLLSRIQNPATLVFDEVHYVPAAKSLIMLEDNLNWVHPPGAKWIMGSSWFLLNQKFSLMAEPGAFRFAAVLFGLWILWAIYRWMRALEFSEQDAQVATWMTGFNFLWFVQAKTAMLDIFYLAFCLWGVLDIFESQRPERRFSKFKFFRGWAFLGLGLSCKWAAAPYFLLALLIPPMLGREAFAKKVAGCLLSFSVYFLTYVPLSFLEKNAVRVNDFFKYHQTMLEGFKSISTASHPYLSHWWEWPTLIRPMWYLYESTPEGDRAIWAGGNPILYWVALPFMVLTVFIAWRSFVRQSAQSPHLDRAARMLALLFWLPLLFWAITPRKLQMYYYYLPSSVMLGPIIVWAYDKFYATRFRLIQNFGLLIGLPRRPRQRYLLYGFALLCAGCFLYFLPVMDGRLLRPGQYRFYMWFRNWI